ncbi:MAG TPA: hypothetical protein VMZ28_11865 [Kofleriaceae bacterium]|nr:hypothetical protein [Kofleriaceae bacterium]
MAWVPCPLCQTQNPKDAMRCRSCGADFADPDVIALGGGAAAMPESAVGEAGSLSASRFLRFSLDELVTGDAARRLAIAGIVLLAVGFIAPLTVDYRELVLPWKVATEGKAYSLFVFAPVAAIVAGLVLAFAPGLPARARAGALAPIGLLGLATLPFLGRFAGAPQAPLALAPLFVSLAAAAVALRLHDPASRRARLALAVATGLTVVAFFVPFSDAFRVLPTEVRFWLREPDALSTGSTAGAYFEVWNSDPNVLFICLMGILPLLLLPAALALAWQKPSGVWDRAGMALRPIGWVLVLYLPLSYLLAAFNLTGMDFPGRVSTGDYISSFEHFARTTMMGRLKLAALAAGYGLWAALGAIPWLRARSGRSG